MRWLLAVAAVGVLVAGAVVAWRRIVRARRKAHRRNESHEILGKESSAAPRTIRFNAHLLFAEGTGRQIIVDGLAEAADRNGAVVGVPFSLVLARPASSLAEDLFVAMIGQWSEECQVELDLTDHGTSVRMLTVDGEFAIDVESAAGLPSP
jgi:hypothetical protein